MDKTKAILLHSEGRITNKKLLSVFSCTEDGLPKTIIEMLDGAINDKSSEKIEESIYLISVFNLYNKNYSNYFNRLILEDWHNRHEDIASALQRIKDPASVEFLYKAMHKKLDYLEYDDSYAFAVKCIWALGAIRDNNAIDKLKLLTESENEIISSNAKEQLKSIIQRVN